MRAPRRKPDYEADSVEMTADSIKDKGHFHGRKTHGRNRAVAKGDIEVTVPSSIPGRPPMRGGGRRRARSWRGRGRMRR